MRVLELIGWVAAALSLLAWIEMRYRSGRYGPVQEVGLVVGTVVLLASLGSLGRLFGI
jgi:hypothetical protein